MATPAVDSSRVKILDLLSMSTMLRLASRSPAEARAAFTAGEASGGTMGEGGNAEAAARGAVRERSCPIAFQGDEGARAQQGW